VKPSVAAGDTVVGGEVGRNLVFNVASAKPLPVPVGAPPALPAGYVLTGTPVSMPGGAGEFSYDALFHPSEYPWGRFVAVYYSGGNPAVQDWIDYIYEVSNAYENDDYPVLTLPAVSVPSAFGLPVKDCYSAELLYNLSDNRFYMDYDAVDYKGPNCLSAGRQYDGPTSEATPEVVEAAAPAEAATP
jgi:hypothetical protein